MTAERAAQHILSPEEYLKGETASPVKHEYLSGVIYAMAGARNAHNRIATNALGSLYAQLRGRGCQPFNSDTKVRIEHAGHLRFYYPDVQVVCEPNPPDDTFQDRPVVIIEVIFEDTRRTDEQEKREAYLTLPSLRVYVLVEQYRYAATVWRKGSEGWGRETIAGLESTINLPEVESSLPLRELYAGAELPPALTI